MQQDLVTVCIPVYNDESNIGNAIKSVLNQTYQNLEILISDNNSTDKTYEVIKSFDDKRIRAWKNDENIGWRLNSNKVLGHAGGKYVVTLHGDDVFYPNYIENVVQIFSANKNVGIIHFVDKNSKQKYFKGETFLNSEQYYSYSATLNPMPAPTDTAYLNDAIKGSEYYAKNYWTGEARLSMEIANRGYSAYICDEIFSNRDTGDIKDSQLIKNRILILDDIFDFYNENKDNVRIIKEYKQDFIYSIIKEMLFLYDFYLQNLDKSLYEKIIRYEKLVFSNNCSLKTKFFYFYKKTKKIIKNRLKRFVNYN